MSTTTDQRDLPHVIKDSMSGQYFMGWNQLGFPVFGTRSEAVVFDDVFSAIEETRSFPMTILWESELADARGEENE